MLRDIPVSRDREDAVVVPVVFEQFLAIAEKARHRQRVVFENDAFGLAPEEPVHSARFSMLASQVLGMELRPDLAGPVDTRCDVPHFLAKILLTGARSPRAIAGHVKPRWTNGANRLEDAAGKGGAIEDEK